jgi:DNA uptake protein ComE-like DNA-binding protein
VIWAFGVLLTFGMAAPILFAVAGARAHKRSWLIAAVLYGVLSWGGLALFSSTAEDSPWSDIGLAAWLIAWAGASAHAFMVRDEYQRRLAGAANPLEAARTIVETRKEAHRLVLKEPDVARELGVGRPDLPDARSMGVVDFNHASAEALATLPGIDNHLARDIVAAREDIDGFASLEDLGGVMDLNANLVDDLRPYVVFLPR